MQQLYLPLKFGRQLITRIADPAVQTEFTYSPDNSLVEEIQSVFFRFVTDVNAATRQVTITISDPTGVILRIGTTQTQTLSQTQLYQAINGSANFESTNTSPVCSFFALPVGLIIPRGGNLKSLINATQAGDQISQIIIITRAWARP